MLPIWQFNYTALLGSYLLIPGNINCFHKRQNELAVTNCVYELTKQLRQCIKGNNQIFSGRYKASPPSTKELHGYAFGGPQQGYILPCLCGTSSIVIPLASHFANLSQPYPAAQKAWHILYWEKPHNPRPSIGKCPPGRTGQARGRNRRRRARRRPQSWGQWSWCRRARGGPTMQATGCRQCSRTRCPERCICGENMIICMDVWIPVWNT